MAFGDKPVIQAQDAAKAAAIAKEAADLANQAAGAVQAVAPASEAKDITMKVLGAVAVVGGTVATAMTAGTLPAIIAGAAGIASYIAGLFHSTPSK